VGSACLRAACVLDGCFVASVRADAPKVLRDGPRLGTTGCCSSSRRRAGTRSGAKLGAGRYRPLCHRLSVLYLPFLGTTPSSTRDRLARRCLLGSSRVAPCRSASRVVAANSRSAGLPFRCRRTSHATSGVALRWACRLLAAASQVGNVNLLDETSVRASTGAARVIWWVGLALCVVQLLKHIADGSLREFYFISDHLYVPALFEDLTRWSGMISDWKLTPSPYFFPDMLLYAAVRSLGASIEWAQYCSGLGLMLLCLAAGRMLIVVAAPQLRTTSALVAPVFALWIALHADHLVSRLVAQLAVISCHGGAVAASFATLTLCFVTGRYERVAAWARCLVAVAAGASDPLYIVSCSLPLLVLAAQPACWQRGLPGHDSSPERAARGHYLGAAAAGIAGVLLAAWINARSTAGYLQPRPTRSARALTQLISDLMGPSRIELGLLTGMLALASYLVLGLPRVRRTAGLRALALWQIASLLSTLAACVLTGRYSGEGTLRYLLVPFTFGVVLAAAAAAHGLQSRALFGLRTGLIVAGAVTAALAAYVWFNWQALRFGQYNSDVRVQAACVAAIDGGAVDGVVLTDYWNAKPLRLMSGGRVHAVQMTEALGAPRWWINSKGWYRGVHDFGVIVTNDLNPDAIVADYGPPTRIERCGSLELFVYRGQTQMRLVRAMLHKFDQFLAAP
jgi:hypothetical protein